MNHNYKLTDEQIEKVKVLAENARRDLGVFPNVPVADDINMLIEKKNIYICEYPFQTSEGSHTDATITWFETNNGPMTFIGLNSALFFDEQVFALAHELYHFQTKTGKAYINELDEEDTATERMADRFAAELLLPRDELRSSVRLEFPNEAIKEANILRILRFIARLQCKWWLPYQSIVLRLYEEGHIEKCLYDQLYSIDARAENSEYGKILKSIDEEKYKRFNTRTKRKRISTCVLEIIIQNFEDGIIGEDEFVECLEVFGHTPEDFGFTIRKEEDADLNLLF